MQKRLLGKTGFEISAIGLGTWQVGGKWGSPFSHANAEEVLQTAIENGVNFIDTADVYSDGESEKAVGKAIKKYRHKIYVATKCGRRIAPHLDSNYTTKILRQHVEDSLLNMGLECIDLVQLHCMPNDTYYRPEVFELFEKLKEEGKILHMGVSVEKIEQAIKSLQYPIVSTIQIIYNMWRQRPNELLFKMTKDQNVGIIVRVPLASGLLTGQYDEQTIFERGDHRNDNRDGQQFDKGETFSGVDYINGVNAAKELKSYFKNNDLAQVAIKWTLEDLAVSCVIPGASNAPQVINNLAADHLLTLSEEDMSFVKTNYEKYIKPYVHQQW
jgi:aryl-alcohol dehydrogenase-like predicted oxidoreductase